MRGGAQSHLMRCTDDFYYVVKFQNNPQHTRVLVNDWLGTRLAEMIGLPVPVAAIVDVDSLAAGAHARSSRRDQRPAHDVHRRPLVRLALRGLAASKARS